MFGKTATVKLTIDATTGLPQTDKATVTEKSVVAGAMEHLTSLASADTVVIGTGRVLGEAIVATAAWYGSRAQAGLPFSFNPFAKA